MSAATMKSSTATGDTEKGQAPIPFLAFYNSELVWSPYRAMSKLLLQSERNVMAILKINRSFSDDVQQIIRREQDMIGDITTRMLQRLSDGGEKPTDARAAVSGSFAELYEATFEGVREFGKAMSEAQARTIEIMRGHANATAMAVGQAVTEQQPVVGQKAA